MIKQSLLTKDEFVAILREAGITEEQMVSIHRSFERRSPEAHQQFLEYLQIREDEIKSIRRM